MHHDVYILDTLFAIFYLTIKRIAVAYFEVNQINFEKYRKEYHYLEFSVIMFGVIYMPQHTREEQFVAFMFCFVIKWCYNNIGGINNGIKRIVERLCKDA